MHKENEQQKRFGRIVVSLRQEHRDPHTDNRWTQSQLGNAANLSEAIIGKIERGERVHLDSDTLLRLSNALDLHGAEQRAFFALGSAVGTTALPNANLSKQFRDRILHTAARVQAPCLLQNAFFDMIAVNDGWLRLYGLSGQLFAANYQSARVANWLGLLYDPQFSLRQLLGERWRALALESLQKFRITALPHRHLAHFNQLIARLRALPNFSVHWKDARTHLPDPTLNFRMIEHPHPEGIRVQYVVATAEIVTPEPLTNLYALTATPLDEPTHRLFQRWLNQSFLHLPMPWPLPGALEFHDDG